MQSRATTYWEGDLMSGKGKTTAGSGTFRDVSLSWKARTEGVASNTTPEELLAASHASCFSMALSHALAQGGHAPRRLETGCTVEFGPKAGGGFEVKSSSLEVKGQVPGIDQAADRGPQSSARGACARRARTDAYRMRSGRVRDGIAVLRIGTLLPTRHGRLLVPDRLGARCLVRKCTCTGRTSDGPPGCGAFN